MVRLCRAEMTKLVSTRLWVWLLLASVATTALYASLAIAFADDPANPSPPLDTSDGQAALFASAQGASSLVAVLGAIGLTTEYRHKTATATFLATPRRGRIVIAKLLTYFVVGIGYGICCLATVAAVALPWLAAKGIEITTDGKVDVVVRVLAAIAIFAVLGVGLAALVREQVATVVGLLIYLFVIEPIITRIGTLQDWSRYLPGAARDGLSQVTQTAGQQLVGPWQGAAVLVAYTLLLAVAGTVFAVRRDVT